MTKSKNKTPATTRSRFAKCDPGWLQLDLTGRQLRVLLALSLHADWSPNGYGRCFPRRDTLALETKLQVSHVSEAVGELSDTHRLLTIVRLGRKNVYYVREMGSTSLMPPSDPDPFFEYLGKLGVHLNLLVFPELTVQYLPESRSFDDIPQILRRIFSDYVNGLTSARLSSAIKVNQATPTAGIVETALRTVSI